MKIEKLNTDKIRITLNIEDLKNSNIDFHSFMANTKESQNLFLYMLDLAEEQVGFVTDNYKVSIETIYLNDGCFILNVTRFKGENFFKNPRVKIKRKEFTNEINSSIYIFSSINNFLDFYSRLKNSVDLATFNDCKYSLFYFKNQYYMIINSNCLNIKYKTLFLYILSEFASITNNCSSLITKLREYGKCICEEKKFV